MKFRINTHELFSVAAVYHTNAKGPVAAYQKVARGEGAYDSHEFLGAHLVL